MTTDSKLGDELLKQNGEATASPTSASVERVMRRERWRVRRWAIATAALWIITAAYLLGMLLVYAVFLHPRVHEHFTSAPDLAERGEPGMMGMLVLLKASLWWPALLFAAAVCTTLFTLASRRATLRQIQASLAEISAQLHELAKKT